MPESEPQPEWKRDRMGAMEVSNDDVSVRPARDVRLVEEGGKVVAYPEPHRTPVLPAGWAPLTREQQDAVLQACESAPDCLQFRVGSPWDSTCEYRVYRLQTDLWGGLALAVKCTFGGSAQSGLGLLGLAREPLRALRIAIDFFNWDLEAHSQQWRLAITKPED